MNAKFLIYKVALIWEIGQILSIQTLASLEAISSDRKSLSFPSCTPDCCYWSTNEYKTDWCRSLSRWVGTSLRARTLMTASGTQNQEHPKAPRRIKQLDLRFAFLPSHPESPLHVHIFRHRSRRGLGAGRWRSIVESRDHLGPSRHFTKISGRFRPPVYDVIQEMPGV